MTEKIDETINRVCTSLNINDRNSSLPLLIATIVEWCNATYQNETSEVSKSILVNQLNGSLKQAIPHFEEILKREDAILILDKELVEKIEKIQQELEDTNTKVDVAQKRVQKIKQTEEELREKQNELKELKNIQAIPEEDLKEISEKIKTLVTDYPILADVSYSTDLLFQHLNEVETTLIQVRRYQTEEKQKKILNLTEELTVIKTENLTRSEEIARLNEEIERYKQKTEKISAEKIALEKKYTESKENFTKHYEENLKVAEGIHQGNLPDDLSGEFSKIQKGLDGLDQLLTSLLITKNEQNQA